MSDTPNSDYSPQSIVVGFDGSANAARALRWAAHFAQSLAVDLDVVWVIEQVASSALGWGYPILPLDHEKLGAQLRENVADALCRVEPVSPRLHIVDGAPAERLIELSRTATMLIVGSRGHGGLANLLLGSVGARCAEHASCPVLIVHDTEPVPTAAAMASPAGDTTTP